MTVSEPVYGACEKRRGDEQAFYAAQQPDDELESDAPPPVPLESIIRQRKAGAFLLCAMFSMSALTALVAMTGVYGSNSSGEHLLETDLRRRDRLSYRTASGAVATIDTYLYDASLGAPPPEPASRVHAAWLAAEAALQHGGDTEPAPVPAEPSEPAESGGHAGTAHARHHVDGHHAGGTTPAGDGISARQGGVAAAAPSDHGGHAYRHHTDFPFIGGGSARQAAVAQGTATAAHRAFSGNSSSAAREPSTQPIS
mmetsp:Transcript_42327/g.133560  ORF Transcript_42327/g.133560 Transcript_42327/m.133560 type:complete len:255 (-) Transcript_42327:9-773(-)